MSLRTAGRVLLVTASLSLTLQLWLASSLAQTSSLTEQLPNGPMHDKATTACTECHEARIIAQQRLSKAAWTKEVDKMMKWGAIVDAADRDGLIDYLSSNFSPDQPPYTPPRSARIQAVHKSAGSHQP
ncbi:MAG TPA: hypothetical protein VJQ54_20645 [Candidatus Sulfotelmatobacter sp.]|nr:hypothetical protein [Candidatus Sulfotelmatobacter sp.]